MFIYTCTCEGGWTACATTPEAAQLHHWDYVPEVEQMEVPDDCQAIYRVYCFDIDLDVFVETLEEAKAIIRQYHGQTRRACRRWRIPIEGEQLTLF